MPYAIVRLGAIWRAPSGENGETTALTCGCLPNWSRMSTISACTAGSSTVLPCRVWNTTSTSSPARAAKPLSSRSWAFFESEPGVVNVKW